MTLLHVFVLCFYLICQSNETVKEYILVNAFVLLFFFLKGYLFPRESSGITFNYIVGSINPSFALSDHLSCKPVSSSKK